MKIGSLFTGYGGLDLAVEEVFGATTAWTSDIDSGACKIIAHRFPGVPNLGDITKINWADVEPVDIITGGSPCQDLSHAGKRQGMRDGTRSNLWAQMRSAIDTIRPSLVVWENVRGALSADATSDLGPCEGCLDDPRDRGPVLRALGRVLGDLAELGYDAQWHSLRAADVGAPHGRFRVFLAAYPVGGGLNGWTHEPVRSTLGGAPATWGGEAARHLLSTPVADNSRGLPSSGTDYASLPNVVCSLLPTPTTQPTTGNGHARNLGAEARLLPTPAVNDMGEGKTVEAWDEWTAKQKAAHGNGNGHGASLAIEAQRLLPTPTAMDHKASGGGYNGQTNVTLTDATVRNNAWAQYADAIHRWEALTRLAPDPVEESRPLRTLAELRRPAGMRGRIYRHVRLSARLPEWMMGLPDGWICDVPGITRNEALKAAGNGVVPQQAAAALLLMASAWPEQVAA